MATSLRCNAINLKRNVCLQLFFRKARLSQFRGPQFQGSHFRDPQFRGPQIWDPQFEGPQLNRIFLRLYCEQYNDYGSWQGTRALIMWF
jgi:hypothetical protein